MQPTVSVIIPVYNVDRWLDACLDSVSAQTFADFEAIVIDDGSTDGSSEIIRRHAAADPRFVVIRTENRGVSQARERALTAARGAWIAFLDGDDVWEPAILERLLEAAGGCDIVCCDYKRVTRTYGRPVRNRCPRDMQGLEFLEALVCHAIAVTLWARLYRRELFEGVGHYPLPLGEDSIINIQIACRSPKVRFIDYVGYNYIQRGGSLNHRSMDFSYCRHVAAIVGEVLDRHAAAVGTRGGEFRTLSALRWYLVYLGKSSNPWVGGSEYVCRLRGEVRRYRKEVRRCFSRLQLLLLKLDCRRELRPAVRLLGTVMRWRNSLSRRFAR